MSTYANPKNKLKVREKIQKLKDDIDIAEEREREAKENLKEAEALVTQHQSDCSSKKNKIVMAKKALEDRRVELNEKQAKLQELTTKQDKAIELVKTLETKEQDCDEELSYKEETHKKIQQAVENRELENKELNLKMAQLDREVQRAMDREEKAVGKIESLTGRIAEMKSILDQKRQEDYMDEDESDKKLVFLNTELHTKICEAEEQERMVNKLEKDKEKILTEIEHMENRAQEVKDELKNLLTLDDEL